MRSTVWSALLVGLTLLGVGAVVWSSEADELRERAEALRKKAAAVAAEGKPELAEQLEREAATLLEAAERTQPKPRRDRAEHADRERETRLVKEQLKDLVRLEEKLREKNAPERELDAVRQQIAKSERRLQQLHGAHDEPRPEHRAQVEKLAAAGRRLEHLRAAAEHLHAADLHDMAHHVAEQAERLEHDLRAAKERLAAEASGPHGPPAEHLPDFVRELRQELQQLRAELQELRQKIEPR